MSMADIITLSSSPPTFFARSPTPIALSSSPHKTRDEFSGHHDTAPCQFKPAQALRDGFSPAFTTARHVLRVKPSTENLPIASPTLLKSRPKDVSTKQSGCPHPKAVIPRVSVVQNSAVLNDESKGTIIQILPSDVRRTKKVRESTSLNINKAVARRRDWTPPKHELLDGTITDPAGFGMKLHQSFGYVNSAISFSVEDGSISKRRKIDLTTKGITKCPAVPATLTKSAKSVSKARTKSPTKKSLTITGLTTSHYLEDEPDRENSTLMMQFLASTQARMQSDGSSDMFETSLKSNKSKKRTKSRLKSPRTSIRTISQQDVVFASASQLARDESPTLLRDTAEAIRQSEGSSFNEQILTQQTVSISTAPESPQTGVARYRGMRNLWCAAHRDENDALLYRNDLFDEPEVRASLAGKNALVEDGGQVEDMCGPADDSLVLLAALNKDSSIVCDIDDLMTPVHTTSKPSIPNAARRMYSTTSQTPSKRITVSPPPALELQHDMHDGEGVLQKSKIPPKPNYASWTDEQLKNQVKEYGFNRLRARKSMIDKLDEYWAQKYGLDVAAVKAATKAASKTINDRDHAHFLSKVHELAPRPQPKTSKSRTKRNDGGPFPGISKTKSKLVKVQNQPAVPPQGDIFDIDELDNTTALERLATIKPFPDDEPAEEFLEPSTAPTKGTGVKATAAKVKRKAKTKPAQRPPTPPPTHPEALDPIFDSSPGFASQHPKTRPPLPIPTITPLLPNTEPDPSPSLKSHIRSALLNPSSDKHPRNHQTHPTWHEKILLYDPIVLEDFTAWLNTEGFNGIGVDDEIDAKEVKVWCEENGICCLWRGGWRGNAIGNGKRQE